MLIAIVLKLTADRNLALPPHLGRANYAATLRRLEQVEPGLGDIAHAGEGPKPLTCSSLLNHMPRGGQSLIRAGETVQVRITGLEARISQALRRGLLEDPPATWELDGETFRVTETICDARAHGWTGQAGYQELLSTHVQMAEEAPAQVQLEFGSPTAFSSKGLTMPVPLPYLVFGSLVDRWNAYSPIPLAPDTRQFVEENVALSRYDLHTRPVQTKNSGLYIGAEGIAQYTAVRKDRYWLMTLNLLADFALFSGVGTQTTIGMGQARRHWPEP
jgi:CRISPR-associated endoribonuclease Cas6